MLADVWVALADDLSVTLDRFHVAAGPRQHQDPHRTSSSP